jgi:hypothetical protein
MHTFRVQDQKRTFSVLVVTAKNENVWPLLLKKHAISHLPREMISPSRKPRKRGLYQFLQEM